MDSNLEHFKATIARRNKRKDTQSKRFNKAYLDAIRSQIHNQLEFPEPTPDAMEILKSKIRKERRLHRMKERIVYAIIMLILVSVFFHLI